MPGGCPTLAQTWHTPIGQARDNGLTASGAARQRGSGAAGQRGHDGWRRVLRCDFLFRRPDIFPRGCLGPFSSTESLLRGAPGLLRLAALVVESALLGLLALLFGLSLLLGFVLLGPSLCGLPLLLLAGRLRLMVGMGAFWCGWVGAGGRAVDGLPFGGLSELAAQFFPDACRRGGPVRAGTFVGDRCDGLAGFLVCLAAYAVLGRGSRLRMRRSLSGTAYICRYAAARLAARSQTSAAGASSGRWPRVSIAHCG